MNFGMSGRKNMGTHNSVVNANVINMTGRQRKKVASRSKGGDFINQRKKRRLYFASVSNEIDIQDMFDYLIGSGGSYQQQGWNYMIYDRVLWLYKEAKSAPNAFDGAGTGNEYTKMYQDQDIFSMKDTEQVPGRGPTLVDESDPVCSTFPAKEGLDSIEQIMATTEHYKITESGAQEIFVFDFGAVVMWGFSRMEEANMLKTVRMFATGGLVIGNEFEDGEDDMAFVYTSYDSWAMGRECEESLQDASNVSIGISPTISESRASRKPFLTHMDNPEDSRESIETSMDANHSNARVDINMGGEHHSHSFNAIGNDDVGGNAEEYRMKPLSHVFDGSPCGKSSNWLHNNGNVLENAYYDRRQEMHLSEEEVEALEVASMNSRARSRHNTEISEELPVGITLQRVESNHQFDTNPYSKYSRISRSYVHDSDERPSVRHLSPFKEGHKDQCVNVVTIANDMVILPYHACPKQRLAISYALAQSTITSVFESRVQKKTDEYRYMPEELAKCGFLQLSQKSISIMIGEVFTIQHNINLHSEILDTPDFFTSKDKKYLETYGIVHEYLELTHRAAVLNKRLSLMHELLGVLLSQMENAHMTELEWIVIWLIVISVVLDMCGGLTE